MANKLRVQRGEAKYHFDAFKDLYAMVDLDDDGSVTIDEMLTFERDRLKENDDFIIAIYWIGYSVSEKFIEMNPTLEKKLRKAGMLENLAFDSELHHHYEIDVRG